MLDHDEGVADVPKFAQNSDKPLCVTWMEPDARLVKDVHRTYKRTAQRRHQIDPLALTAREGIAGAAKRQVGQPDVLDVPKTRHDLIDGLVDNRVLIVGQPQVREEAQKLVHVHVEKLSDVPAAYLHVKRLRPESRTVTCVTRSPAREAAEHVLVLNLVAVGLNPLEELVDADDRIVVTLNTMSVPDDVLYLLREIAVWLEDRDAVTRGHLYHVIPEPAHGLAPPAGDGSVIDAFRLVRDDQILTHTDDLSETAADRTRSQRAVEREKIFIRLAECHAVQFEAAGIFLDGIVLAEDEPPLPHPESRVDRGA